MRSVRLRLLLLALLPLLVLMPLLLGIAIWRGIDKFDELLIAKVASDLRIAQQYLHRIEDTQAAQVAALAESVGFREAAARGEAERTAYLEAISDGLGLDFLQIGRLGDGSLPDAAQAVARRAEPETPSAGLAIFTGDDLARLAPALAEAARLTLVPTEAARPIDRDVETRGMVLLAAHRVSGTELILVGGRLLNRNLDFIDTMNDLIYRDDEDLGQRTGTTTLFLDDVRISTNVRLFEGNRALGTRVSEVVWKAVMGQGETWLDRAFVVNDWYISGYQPVTDIGGERIGMLYTGFLEAPFSAQKNTTVLNLALAFLAVMFLSIPIFLRLARGVFSPLERMTATMVQVEDGALTARIGKIQSDDEIGEVARHLDRLLDQVQERDEALRGYAENLNKLVDQRTKELQEANHKLEETFAQLLMKEKLASIGEITAGVAHEINNPVAVIQGNLEVLRAELGTAAESHATELDLIDAQTSRIDAIVGKLLNFTRSGEAGGTDATVDPGQAVADALVLVAADLKNHRVEVRQSLVPTPLVRMVDTELQQVLVNLMINAAHAMREGGVLTITNACTEFEGRPGVAIEVADTGSGIAPEKLDQVFDPFFTTKPAEGTGLGLSISQNLVNRAGGLITVKSVVGEGSKFSVWIPRVDSLSEPDGPGAE
ncbi:MAG: cache domain-containing protein [Pseudomonadota bacterium]